MTTGISAYERARTIEAAIDPESQPVTWLGRATYFPFAPAPVVCSNGAATPRPPSTRPPRWMRPGGRDLRDVNDDGTMARVPDLVRFCRKHGLTMITIADLVRYQLDSEYQSYADGNDRFFLSSAGDGSGTPSL